MPGPELMAMFIPRYSGRRTLVSFMAVGASAETLASGGINAEGGAKDGDVGVWGSEASTAVAPAQQTASSSSLTNLFM